MDIGKILGLGPVSGIVVHYSSSGHIRSSSFGRIDNMITNVSIPMEYLGDVESVYLCIGPHRIDEVQLALPLQRSWTHDALFAAWACSQLPLPLDVGKHIASFLQPIDVQVPFYLDDIPIALCNPVVIRTVSRPGCRTVPLSCELVAHKGWTGIRYENGPISIPMRRRYLIRRRRDGQVLTECRSEDNEFVFDKGHCGWRMCY
jgi:hypothetical protein